MLAAGERERVPRASPQRIKSLISEKDRTLVDLATFKKHPVIILEKQRVCRVAAQLRFRLVSMASIPVIPLGSQYTSQDDLNTPFVAPKALFFLSWPRY